MESTLKRGQPTPADKTGRDPFSSFAFPMMVLFGTYTFWIVVAGVTLLVLTVIRSREQARPSERT